jgi:PAS domain-containing protein
MGENMGFGLSIELIGIGLLAAAIGLMIAAVLPARNPYAQSGGPDSGSEGPVYLFDGETLVDCNAAGRALLARSAVQGGDWQKLVSFLDKSFGNIDEKLGNLSKLGALAETAETTNGKILLLQAELGGGLTKILLTDPDLADGLGVALAMSHRALETEVEDLRRTVSSAPLLIWRENQTGQVTWANDAYLILACAALSRGAALSWPLPRLFDRAAIVQSASGQTGTGQRQSVRIGSEKAAWFDLMTEADGTSILCFAQPADAAVTAENTLREFMQTLSKTFAQLPIGLAIFDKDRKLQMFNPALVELTTLPPDFLTRKPSMLAVLDAMRDRNLLPEPRDYQGWRRQIVEMERAAASGLFQENWALPDGQTFRVTGRPHPNGGLALMIEDISSEMQRSRRYRADLEISQSVIDQLDEAIAVFDQSGHLLSSNAAYCELWNHDPASNLDDTTIRTLTVHWKTRTAATPLWVEIDEFIHTVGSRIAWSKDLRLLDGRAVICSVAPVASGATMVAFKLAAPPHRREKSGAVKSMTGSATAAR